MKIWKAAFALALGTTLYGVNVGDETALENAIIAANGGGDASINFTSNIVQNQNFRPLNCTDSFSPANETFTINGNNFSLTTGGNFRGFFVRGGTGTITLQNMTFNSHIAKGGDVPNPAGGGGAGLGGALFVEAGSPVIVDNVSFVNCSAVGGSTLSGVTAGTGGGGLGGNGGDSPSTFNSGGGGSLFQSGGAGTANSGGGGRRCWLPWFKWRSERRRSRREWRE